MRASTGIQPRKGLPPMVSEFIAIQTQPAHLAIPSQARKLSTPQPGVSCTPATGVSNASAPYDNQVTTIGIHRTPEEFVKEAISIGHPTRLHSMFPDEISEVVRKCLSSGCSAMALERTEEIKRWIHMAEQFKEAEHTLKDSISERRRNIVADKKLVLLRTLLAEAGHGDTNLVDDLATGFGLIVTLPESNSSRKVRPASISCEELRRVADMCRDGMLEMNKSSGLIATRNKIYTGFIEGPISPASLPEGATLTRRFVVKQKSKTRPIDIYKSSFVGRSHCCYGSLCDENRHPQRPCHLVMRPTSSTPS